MTRREKYTIQEVCNYVKKLDGVCLSTIYINNKEKLDFLCKKCNYRWSMAFKCIKVQKQWCPNCVKRVPRSIHDARIIAFQRNGLCLSSYYINNKENLKWKCNKCNNIWLARFDRVNSGTWCRNCSISHGEKIVSKYLDKRNIIYKREWYIPKGRKNEV